ncbi:sulfotransferase domain-containing protein [Micromonospora sp. NPDC023956]|uniref:sulfotransferase domain-containing protein n=1 Tax=Micromonospora sp. NPDC023956 TaxID=3155722 RepID=UPI0033D96B38
MSDSALWAGFPLRDGDVVISTPPKCGTSWMQMLCALLILDSPDLPRPLTELSPWLDAVSHDLATTVATLENQQHRRFIKTHTPLDGLPFDERVTYLCQGRDPRDVAMSFDAASANINPAIRLAEAARAGVDPRQVPPPPADPLERFWQWADGEFVNDPTSPGVTLVNLVHHVRTFWDRRDEPGVVLFHYNDLLTDLPGQLRRLATVLAIDLSDRRIEELAAAATFERMRERADELAPGVSANLWRSNREFFHSGTSGQWRSLLSPSDVRRYEERLAELAPPALAEWLRSGWLGSGMAMGEHGTRVDDRARQPAESIVEHRNPTRR